MHNKTRSAAFDSETMPAMRFEKRGFIPSANFKPPLPRRKPKAFAGECACQIPSGKAV